ncbi:MAG TPA: NADH-quinone oxidoreductase subunit N [Chthoniobacterales bacterium]|nr:NADH-quinone oxidoreductase subunit N [Chthoniobacterales bacterium]
MSYLNLLKLGAPEAIVVLIALAVLTIGLTNDRARGLPGVVAAFGILIAIWTTARLPQQASLFGGMLVISPLNSLFKMICLGLAFVTVPLAVSEKSLRNPGEYLAMLLLGTLGLLLLVGSEELLMIFIGLELLGLSLYVMAAFDKTDVRSAEAGLKYYLFGSTASAFTLFGISLVYGMSGTTSLALITLKLGMGPIQPLMAVGIVMTLIGFAFKIAAAPFHLWAPDAYQGAPVPSSAFIASGSKVAAFVVLGKIVLIGFAPAHGNAGWHMMQPGWSPILAALAAFSILLGNFVALAQTNVRRLLAYSAVAHAGYTLLGLVAGGRDGFSATLFYTTIYAITLIGAFGVVGMVKRETGGDDFQNFAGLASRRPLAAGCMAIFMLSLAGLPPLAGFFGKFYLFSAAFRSGGNHGLLWLVVLALFGSFVSLYYYLSVLKVIFVDQPPAAEPGQGRTAAGQFLPLATIVILAAAILILGVLPGTLAAVITKSVP